MHQVNHRPPVGRRVCARCGAAILRWPHIRAAVRPVGAARSRSRCARRDRSGFWGAAWRVCGGGVGGARATCIGMWGAARAPHLAACPRVACPQCFALSGHHYSLRSQSCPVRATHQHKTRSSGYGTYATGPGATWLAGRSAPPALPPAATLPPTPPLRLPSPLTRALCCAAATNPPRCAPKVAANSPSAARARARSAHRPRSGPDVWPPQDGHPAPWTSTPADWWAAPGTPTWRPWMTTAAPLHRQKRYPLIHAQSPRLWREPGARTT